MSDSPQSSMLPERTPLSGPTHLIVLANGLFGSPANWTTILTQLEQKLDRREVLLHASRVNRRTDTYDGIDVCGWRLADEIRSVVRQHPSLQRISVIGHSMGGLLLRFAIGVTYDPGTGRVAGLLPCHFITLATPHLGCDSDGVSQVPFIGWLGVVPPVKAAISALSVPVGSLIFRRTGLQFFLADDDAGARPGLAGLPLLARMTHDVPERGEHFWSALCAFATRTCYANTGQDHLVGWANSSLRFLHQLPELPPEASSAKGVVLEDPLLASFDTRFKPQAEPQRATSARDVPVQVGTWPGLSRRSSQDSARAGGASRGAHTTVGGADAAGWAARGAGRPTVSVRADVAADDGNATSGSQLAEGMLHRLQSLAWRRIDVCFKGAALPFAHNHIQVTRRWLNFEGESVAIHLAEQVAALEAAYEALQQADDGQGNTTLVRLERVSGGADARSAAPPRGSLERSSPARSVASKEAVTAALDAGAERRASLGGRQGSRSGSGLPDMFARSGDPGAAASSSAWVLDAVDDTGAPLSDVGMDADDRQDAHPTAVKHGG